MSRARRKVLSALIALLTLLGLCFATTLAASPAQADATHQAVIGMPFTGKWAYNVNVNPPYTDANSSHPSVHAKYYGDWATDVYAAEGAPVKLEVPYATGSLSYSWISFTNGSCGQRTVIAIKVDGVDVGSVYYEHLNNAVKSGAITNGMTVGTVHAWSSGCNPGPHVHVEFKNTSSYSCYVDNGHPGVTLDQGDALGVLGSTNTGERQACASVPSGGATAQGSDTPGIVRSVNGAWQWNLHNANAPGTAETVFTYGLAATDVPVTGDWDGNGTTTIGIVRPDNGLWHWYLHNANAPGAGEVNFTFGLVATDKPIVGDWDGNGTTTIGIVRNYNGAWQWHLRNSNSSGAAMSPFTYGYSATDTPIVGDWDANGTVTVGVVRPDNGMWHWYLHNANAPGAGENDFTYGYSATDTPIVGDWNGNKSVTPGIVRDYNGAWQWNLRNHANGGAGEVVFTYGLSATDTPVVGDWNGV